MPSFSYRAVTPDGQIQEGRLTADSEHQAADRLADQGLVPLVIESGAAFGAAARESGIARLLRRRGGVGREQVLVLTRELAAMLRSGLPLDRALGILTQLAAEPAVRTLVEDLRERVRGGETFATALEAQDGTFDRFYINMVRAGEAGGSIELALNRLADYLEKAKALRQTVVSALIYPAILLGVALLSIVILLMFVVPQFAQLFEDMGAALPLPTRIVMTAGDLLIGWWWAIAGGAIGIWWLFERWLATPANRLAFDRWLLRNRLTGKLIAEIETARFARTLGTLLTSGVPMLRALAIGADTIGNGVLSGAAREAAEGVKHGRHLSEVLLEQDCFPLLAVHMLKVGEETGRMEPMLDQLADIYDASVQASVKRLLTLLEPALILGLGVIIAAIIMSVLVAILGVNELAF
ncbi:MAG: type II secretion system F family protein [Ectothiorhodospiraceae bacterium]|jgi:general secretion pathway protein F|nr:type II secretion system F family protein [Ectothiorhodospiraceae bacterium]